MQTLANPQLDGIDAIEGTYIFDVRTANRRLAINRFFWEMACSEARAAFHQDEEALIARHGLSDQERMMVRQRDWLGLIQHGVNFFVLEKWARVVKQTNLEVYATMRGMSLEDFLQTRRVPASR